MTRLFLAGTCAAALFVFSGIAAHAQQAADPAPAAEPAPNDAVAGGEPPTSIDFEGGKLTITQQEEYGEKTLAYDGKELAKNYQVNFDRVVTVGGVNVALVAVGNGGNACGPAEVLVWKPKGGEIQSIAVGEEECGAPPASVSDDRIVFLPYLLPGDTALVQTWSPDAGLTTAGELSFSPEPNTVWKNFSPSKLTSMLDAFKNAEIYRMSRKLLGDHMSEVVVGLSVSGAPETTKMGIVFGNGCTPHACGVADSFMAIDTRNKAVYFAHQGGKDVDTWPALKRWPPAIRGLMTTALTPPN
jgi:hypothetical protein